ncbi:hypothetical protein AB0C18_35905 [Nonomuraea muscovyensis]|uniref:hypothetical protein n=1 Tax=Nonomuraea muscovyensis TaxID=1124761 RepID=UPI0033E820A6
MASQETSPTGFDRCMSQHVAMPQRDHVRLEWHPSGLRFDRTRVIAWTCHCRATVYELCGAVGHAFIRRTVQLDDGHQVHETNSLSLRDTWVLWIDLLSGAAR